MFSSWAVTASSGALLRSTQDKRLLFSLMRETSCSVCVYIASSPSEGCPVLLQAAKIRHSARHSKRKTCFFIVLSPILSKLGDSGKCAGVYLPGPCPVIRIFCAVKPFGLVIFRQIKTCGVMMRLPLILVTCLVGQGVQ